MNGPAMARPTGLALLAMRSYGIIRPSPSPYVCLWTVAIQLVHIAVQFKCKYLMVWLIENESRREKSCKHCRNADLREKFLITVYNSACVRLQGQEYEVFLLIGIIVGWDHFYSWRTVAALQKGEEVWCKSTYLGKTHWRALSNSTGQKLHCSFNKDICHIH